MLEHAHGINDVQRFYAVIVPTDLHAGTKESARNDAALPSEKECVVLVMTSKMLPNQYISRDTHWCFVDKVVTLDEGKHAKDIFKNFSYETKTKGKRKVAAAVPCGTATYEILEKDTYVVGKTKIRKPRVSTHLSYKLVMPQAEHMGNVQREFNINEAGEFVLLAKNPQRTDPSGKGFVGLKKAAVYPKDVQALFKGVRVAQRKFVPITDMRLIMQDSAQILWTPVTPAKVLGLRTASEDFLAATEADVELLENVFHGHLEKLVMSELNLDKKLHPLKSLERGVWA